MKVGLFPGQGIPASAVLAGLEASDESLDVANEVLGYDLRRKVEVASRRPKASLPTSLAAWDPGVSVLRRTSRNTRDAAVVG